MKKYNPFSNEWNPQRRSIQAEEQSPGRFRIVALDADPSELALPGLSALIGLKEAGVEFTGDTLEALRHSCRFREVRFSQSETLKPKNTF